MKALTSPDPLFSLGFNWAQMRGEGPRAPQGQALQRCEECEGSQGSAGAGAGTWLLQPPGLLLCPPMSYQHQHKHRSVTSSSWPLGQAVSTTRVTPLSTPWSCAHLAQGCTPVPIYPKCPGVAALRQKGPGDPLLSQVWPWEPPQDHSAHPCSTSGQAKAQVLISGPAGAGS